MARASPSKIQAGSAPAISLVSMGGGDHLPSGDTLAC